jgi:glycosyltransferase involved in cell wall biosynthesis
VSTLQPSPAPENRASSSLPPRLVVVVPCLDEAATVARVVTGIPRRIDGVGAVDVIVIDDGSTDDTAARARDAGAEVVVHAENRGLGWTFREAVQLALDRGADLMVHIDGDGQFDPADVPLLVAPLVAGRADMVTASRFADPRLTPHMPRVKRWGNRRVAGIVALLTGRRFADVSCGFRSFSSEALLRLNLFGRFTYTQESFLDLVFKDLAILEVPVAVRGEREFGASRIASSIPRYAVRSLQIMLGAFISYRPFRFFSVIAFTFLTSGAALLGFLLTHYIRSGAFTPHIWAGFVGGSLSFLGVITLVLGLLGEMLVRMRMNQENILYFLKRAVFEDERRRRRVPVAPPPTRP